MAGFRLANELGCDSIELDVNLTRDGVPVVIHDDTVDRTTDGFGRVDGFDMQHLLRLDAGAGETIPSLADVLRFVRQTSMDVQIELKGKGTEKPAIELVLDFGMSHRVRFTSFDAERLKTAKRMFPHVATGVLLNAVPDNPLEYFDQVGADFCHLDAPLITAPTVRTFHDEGIPVVAFGKVLDVATVDRLVDSGVTQIGSDRPDVVIRRLAQLGLCSPSC